MRFPNFGFGGASFGRDRREARPAGRARRRHNATHRLGGEMLEGRAVLAVIVPAPAVTAVTAVTDSGSSVVRTGGATNAETLTITGTVAPGATTVTVFNGNISLGEATIAGRTWSFATDDLADGTYNFRARATIGTTTSAASARPFVVTVDTAAPVAPTISSVLDDRKPFVGTVPRDGVTNDRTLTLTGTAEPGSRVEVFARSTSLGIATLVGSTWRFTTKPLTTDGDYDFTAQATDRAGNTSAATVLPYTVNVDTGESTPAIETIIDNVGNSPTDVKALQLSNDTTLVIQGTADAGSTVRIIDGRTLLGSAVANGSGVWTLTTRPLTNGQTYRFRAQATDTAGNTSAVSAQSPILIDTTAPSRPLITGVDANGTPVVDRGITNKTRLTISGRAEPGSTVDVYDGILPLATGLIADGSGNWECVLDPAGEGVHTLRARATDAAGNTSVLPSVNYIVTVDTAAPRSPTIDAAIDGVEPGLGVVTGPTNETRPLLTGTTELGSVVKIYDGTLSSATFLGLAAVTGTTWTFRPTSPLSEGSHSLLATATDFAGNESLPGTYEITIDTRPAEFLDFGTEPTDGPYEFGDIVYIDLVFDEPLFVDTTDGTPRIRVNTEPARYATYDSGSGTDTLRFKYEPQLGDKTTGELDVAPAVIDLDGGTIRDAAGNDVNPSITSLGEDRAITIDARLTILPLAEPPNQAPLPVTMGPGPTLSGPLSPLTITFNAPLTRGLTVDSFDLFLEDRSITTAGVIIEDLGNNSFRLTLPPDTHQSIKGRYRLDIGGLGSGIESGGVPMNFAVSLYWQLA